MANMVEGGKKPFLDQKKLEEIGYRIVAYPLTLLNAGVAAMQQALAELHHNSQVRGLPDFSVLQEIVGFKEYYEEVKQYVLAGDSSGDDPA